MYKEISYKDWIKKGFGQTFFDRCVKNKGIEMLTKEHPSMSH